MAIMKVGPIAIISGLALAGVGAAATLMARDDGSPEKADAATVETRQPAQAARSDEDEDGKAADAVDAANIEPPAAEAPPPASTPPGTLDFSIGSIDDLRTDQLAAIVAKIEEVEGVAGDTKIWVATADVASAPGAETFYHVKGPLTCGRIGCDLVVVSASKAVLLETVGEGISAPQIDTLVINQGTGMSVTWVFNGSEYEQRR